MVERASGYNTQYALIGVSSVLVLVLYFLQLLVEWRVKRQRVTYDVYQKYRTARLEAVRRSGGRHVDETEDTDNTTETELTEVKSPEAKNAAHSPKALGIRISVSSEELMPPTTSSRSNLEEASPATAPPIARQWSLEVKKPSKAIPPPDVGKIPWLFHRCGLVIGLLFVVRLVDPWGLEGWYPQSFLDLDSTLATLILYFASCYTVNQFVTLRYNSMSSQPPPALPITIVIANTSTWLVLLFALFWRMAQRESWLLGIHYAYIAFAEAFLTLIFDIATIFLSYKISGLTRQETARQAASLSSAPAASEPKIEEEKKKKRKAKGDDNSTASVNKVILRMRVFAVCMSLVIAVAVAFNLNSAIDSFKKGSQFIDAPEPQDAGTGFQQTAAVLLDNAVALLGFWYSYMPFSYLWKNFFPNLDLDLDENFQYFKKFGVLQGEYVAALSGVPVSAIRPKSIGHHHSRSGSHGLVTPNNSRDVV